jgi:nicotinate-nucleotide pyrophosphorylase (carboxylating)
MKNQSEVYWERVDALIAMALEEDIGEGDLTAEFFIAEEAEVEARFVARREGVISGVLVAKRVLEKVDSGLKVILRKLDGDGVKANEVVMSVKGKMRSIVTAERTALNFLQRLSGVASLTDEYVRAVRPHPVQIWDTRKTTPGWRLLEKAAVVHGGGVNHRMGLYDHVMVKDNHLMGGNQVKDYQRAIDEIHQKKAEARIQIEVDRLEQMEMVEQLRGVKMILLDNMNLEQLKTAVSQYGGKYWLEASGGVTLSTIEGIAATGVNAISVGALTHSAKALDIGLDIEVAAKVL